MRRYTFTAADRVRALRDAAAALRGVGSHDERYSACHSILQAVMLDCAEVVGALGEPGALTIYDKALHAFTARSHTYSVDGVEWTQDDKVDRYSIKFRAAAIDLARAYTAGGAAK